MKQDDWGTLYREGCIASDARAIVGDLWVKAEPHSEAERYLERVASYLQDRFDIAMAFCGVIAFASAEKLVGQ